MIYVSDENLFFKRVAGSLGKNGTVLKLPVLLPGSRQKDMIGHMKDNPNAEAFQRYASRINRVIDFIDANYGESFTLDELAQVADFSKYHFCRIFQGFTGEPLFSFISRIRLEKSADKLCNSKSSTVTEIAADSGYSSPAVFSKAFREKFGVSPSQWRSNPGKPKSNASKPDSNKGKAKPIEFTYIGYGKDANTWRFRMNEIETTVKIEKWPETTVAYVRHVGPYQGNAGLFQSLWNRLCSWAGPRGLLGSPDAKYIIIYHDSPDITDQDKLRTSVCVSVPANTEVSGEVGKLIVDKGDYAVGRFHVIGEEFGQAWEWMYGRWLPASGYQADERMCFELYPQQGTDENGKMVVDIYIPVKPL
jgi:AraC family transcriptional regulator